MQTCLLRRWCQMSFFGRNKSEINAVPAVFSCRAYCIPAWNLIVKRRKILTLAIGKKIVQLALFSRSCMVRSRKRRWCRFKSLWSWSLKIVSIIFLDRKILSWHKLLYIYFKMKFNFQRKSTSHPKKNTRFSCRKKKTRVCIFAHRVTWGFF